VSNLNQSTDLPTNADSFINEKQHVTNFESESLNNSFQQICSKM